MECKKALAKRRRTESAAEARRERQWVLDKDLFEAVMLMCWQSGGEVGPAVKYLEGVAKQRHWPERGEQEIEAFVDDCFLRADPQRLLDLADSSNPTYAAARQLAARCVRDWSLYRWVCDLNENRGARPRGRRLLVECAAHRARCPAPDRPPPRGTMRDAFARMWASRWRVRWGGVYGRQTIRYEVPLVLRQEKVRVFCTPSVFPG